MSLKEVYNVYKKHYHIGDTKKIDLLLATCISQDLPGKNIWLMYVGESGIGKSMITGPISYVKTAGHLPLAIKVSDLTPNTIVSGQQDASLAHDLDGRIMYVPDFSTIVSMRPEDQRQIYSQFRNLYDGFAKKNTGQVSKDNGEEIECDTTFIGNVTPGIYDKQLIRQEMGTRFVFYRINDYQEKDVEESAFNGTDTTEKHKEIAGIIQAFLKTTAAQRQEIDDNIKEWIIETARWTARMRANAKFNKYHGEMESPPYPEKPTRLIKQFRKIYDSLKSLEEDYSDRRALEVIKNVAESSADPSKVGLYRFLKDAPKPQSQSDIVKYVSPGKRWVKMRLQELEAVGLIKENEFEAAVYDSDSSGHGNVDRVYKADPDGPSIPEVDEVFDDN